LWIEREDFMEQPAKGFFRLFPGNQVRLKYGFVVRCTGYSRNAKGEVDEVHCDYLPETKSGTPGADAVKVKGNIHWVSAAHAYETEVRLYDRLFNVPNPGKRTGNYLDDVNPNARNAVKACLEPSLKEAKPEERIQFERHGYFVADRRASESGKPAFNRTVTLRDSWTSGKG
ncbi:MAG TPA: glutamine--tRNA ligase, partial [Usitatibacter sp.]|nr:glutamine--tRNA ligase [Usitatibacter sp.]